MCITALICVWCGHCTTLRNIKQDLHRLIAFKQKSADNMAAKSEERPSVLNASDAIRLGIINSESAVQVIEKSVVRPSLGRAVVALRDIAAGEVICTYGGRVISRKECEAIEKMHTNPFCAKICYMMHITDDWILDGYPETTRSRTNLGSFINDSKGIKNARVNVTFEQMWLDDKRLIVLAEASECITKGEELWVSYGPAWWNFDREATKLPCACEIK